MRRECTGDNTLLEPETAHSSPALRERPLVNGVLLLAASHRRLRLHT